jgi:hypothetical protein
MAKCIRHDTGTRALRQQLRRNAERHKTRSIQTKRPTRYRQPDSWHGQQEIVAKTILELVLSSEFVALKRAVSFVDGPVLTSESVQGSALSFQCINDVHCGDGLSLGMLRVRDRVADNVL